MIRRETNKHVLFKCCTCLGKYSVDSHYYVYASTIGDAKPTRYSTCPKCAEEMKKIGGGFTSILKIKPIKNSLCNRGIGEC